MHVSEKAFFFLLVLQVSLWIWIMMALVTLMKTMMNSWIMMIPWRWRDGRCHDEKLVCVCVRAPKKNTSHGNEVLLQDTTHLIQRPRYQRGSLCQGPAGNRTTRRPPDHCKETQTAVVWSCLPFIRSGQNHLARYSEREKKTRQTEDEVGRHRQGMDRPGGHQVPEGSGEQGKMEETGCKIICGAPMTLVVKG